MKTILKNKHGVSILEGLIALLLLAMISVGTFGVLLSTSRKSSQPDIREEMILAVEKAKDVLQTYSYFQVDQSTLYPASDNNLLQELDNYFSVKPSSGNNPLSNGDHSFTDKMLPPVCDKNHSSFTYTVADTSTKVTEDFRNSYGSSGMDITGEIVAKSISFHITCNGFSYEQ